MTIATFLLALQMIIGGGTTTTTTTDGLNQGQQTGIIVVGDTQEVN